MPPHAHAHRKHTHIHTTGQIDIFFQHVCKGKLANLSTPDRTRLRDLYERDGAEFVHTFYINPGKLPLLEFSDMCKSAMVCKEWNAAVNGALVLLDTLYFSFCPDEYPYWPNKGCVGTVAHCTCTF